MASKMFAVFMFMFLVMVYALFSVAGIKISNDGEILMALDIAALAGATKWDEEATAEAGVIIIDPVEAEKEAFRYLQHNTRHIKTTSAFHVEVVNNAPVTRFVGGNPLYFSSNGIIVSYDNFHQAVEVDDMLLDEIEEPEDGDLEEGEPEQEVDNSED